MPGVFHSLPPQHHHPVVKLARALVPTFRYLMQTEVHVYAFSIAANVLLSFFPFLIVCVSLGSQFLDRQSIINTMDLAFQDVFPDFFGNFLHNNLPYPQKVELLSLAILLFAANGIFEPLEVALNRAWGIRKNRSFLRNQIVSMMLIFVCGSLALLSLAITSLRAVNATGWVVERWVSALFYKSAVVPFTVLILYIVYRFLPNGRPPQRRVIPAAIGVGVLLEGLKSLTVWAGPFFDVKLQREYAVFRHSATLILLSFLTSMLVLGGAEWAARGHRMDGAEGPMPIPENLPEHHHD